MVSGYNLRNFWFVFVLCSRTYVPENFETFIKINKLNIFHLTNLLTSEMKESNNHLINL